MSQTKPKGTFKNIEHHACLTTDELPYLSKLFERGATKIVVNLRGRTTISKSKSRVSELGIKKLSHVYLDVDKENLELSNPDQINTILDAYNREGVSNLFIVSLVVTWTNGDMQKWNRAVLHIKDKETDRIIPSGRLNALVMPVGLYSDVTNIQNQYGTDLVEPTVCEIMDQDKTQKRVCLSVMRSTTSK